MFNTKIPFNTANFLNNIKYPRVQLHIKMITAVEIVYCLGDIYIYIYINSTLIKFSNPYEISTIIILKYGNKGLRLDIKG